MTDATPHPGIPIDPGLEMALEMVNRTLRRANGYSGPERPLPVLNATPPPRGYNAYSVACPSCGSPPPESCRTTADRPVPREKPHVGRVHRAFTAATRRA